MIFGIPHHKDEMGSSAYCDGNIVAEAIKKVKKEYPDIYIIADVCLCEYTNHGHCGFVENGYVNNDKTLPLLAKASVSYAQAGADMIAPSDMMDGRIAYIRTHWMKLVSLIYRLWLTARSFAQLFMDLFVMQLIQHRNLAIEKLIKWIQQMEEKLYVKLCMI